MTTRPATLDELVAHLDLNIKYGYLVRFRHFVYEMSCPHAPNGVSHKQHNRAKVRMIDGVPHVRHHGEIVELTATMHTFGCDEAMHFVIDVRIKSEYLTHEGFYRTKARRVRKPAKIKPHDTLTLFSCDTIAECYDGVSKELYAALWDAMDDMKPLNEQICIEDSSPQDAIGLNTPASVWSKFTRDQQRELNAVCERADAKYDAL